MLIEFVNKFFVSCKYTFNFLYFIVTSAAFLLSVMFLLVLAMLLFVQIHLQAKLTVTFGILQYYLFLIVQFSSFVILMVTMSMLKSMLKV